MTPITNSMTNVPGAISATQSSAPTSSDSTAGGTGLSTMDTESTFLQLLVAQLQNQDPSQPQDGTQFVSELAQFSSVEQQLQMVQDLNTIASAVTGDTSGTTTTNATPATTHP